MKVEPITLKVFNGITLTLRSADLFHLETALRTSKHYDPLEQATWCNHLLNLLKKAQDAHDE